MNIVVVSPAHVCNEWGRGAHRLSEACEKSAGEITADQLKMILARGERVLLAAQEDGVSKAWAAIQIQQLPNIRVLYVYSIYAPGATGPDVFDKLADIARKEGCSEIRGAANDAVAKLWERRFGAEKLYQTVRIKV